MRVLVKKLGVGSGGASVGTPAIRGTGGAVGTDLGDGDAQAARAHAATHAWTLEVPGMARWTPAIGPRFPKSATSL